MLGTIPERLRPMPHNEDCFAMPDCFTCGKRKSPRGRDVPMTLADGYCAHECEGHYKDPQPGHYWPEQRITLGIYQCHNCDEIGSFWNPPIPHGQGCRSADWMPEGLTLGLYEEVGTFAQVEDEVTNEWVTIEGSVTGDYGHHAGKVGHHRRM